jgi:nucleoside-diphosphate-sugar epimerase
MADDSGRGPWSFERDLQDVFEANSNIWRDLKGARIFITGGTGLLGRWMLETLRYADQRLELGVSATILTRNPDAFARKAPQLAAWRAIDLVRGDVCDFASPDGAYSHVIHAATDASKDVNDNDPRRMFDTVVLGTRRALEFAVEKAPDRFFFMSSGAVYGPQPWDVERVSETWMGGPDCTEPRCTYAEGKRAAEMLCAIYAKQFGLNISTARIFALLGPHLVLDIHFAAGNFIRDAIAGRSVVVESSGEACRSYLYLADVTTWMWRIMMRAAPGGVYNVGSEEWVSVRDLAERTARILAQGAFEVRGAADTGWNPGRYVPDTSRARNELGLRMTTSLDEAIRRTALWNGWKA